MSIFFPKFKWTPTLRCTPESNYWGDAYVDHTQTIKKIHSNYWGIYPPSGFRHPRSCITIVLQLYQIKIMISYELLSSRKQIIMIVTARSFIVGFEPRFYVLSLTRPFTLFAYYFCVARLSLFALQSCLKDAPFCRLLITFFVATF